IAGKICDCGATKHLLDMEGMAEETISMAPGDTVYQRIVDFVREAGPHSTVEMVQTGQWDKIYPVYAATCRDLRKELLGTLDVGALWPEPTISRVPELPAPRAEAPVEAAVADTPETTTPQEEVAPST
ncbi:MAG: hypothetical protein Q8R28_01805, partial [Dehalococcoidia bacterium]|nr:hypothetical protein [Dehalococcoidia bacterium]MDP2659452.1 hypothetical protein [Dehalococcoidia bacterium]